jgi:lysophospholipase L1-like esterase
VAGRISAWLKKATLGFIITGMLLAGAETAQRIRYAIRYNHSYWLIYGFVERPKDYRARMDRYHIRPKSPAAASEKAEPPAEESPLPDQRRFEFFTLQHAGYYKFRPGRFEINAQEGIFYTINSAGLRGKEFQIPKPEGLTRIVSLGGSSTFGALNDDGHTYPALLEQLLASDGDGRYEVLNAGFPGAALDHLEAFLSRERSAVEPDIITIYSLFNNIYPVKVQGPAHHVAWRIRQLTAQRSLLFLTALEKYTIWRYGPGFIGAARFDLRGSARMVNNELTWSPFRNHLSNIIEGARDNGTRVLLIKQALMISQGPWVSLLQPNELWKIHIEKARRIIDEAGREYGVPVLDAQAIFPPKELFSNFDDPVHLSDAGNARLARAIHDKLVELGWVRNKDPKSQAAVR